MSAKGSTSGDHTGAYEVQQGAGSHQEEEGKTPAGGQKDQENWDRDGIWSPDIIAEKRLNPHLECFGNRGGKCREMAGMPERGCWQACWRVWCVSSAMLRIEEGDTQPHSQQSDTPESLFSNTDSRNTE